MFTFYLSVLEFLKSVLELNFELAFLSISNLIYTACVACKIKFKIDKNSSSKINFVKKRFKKIKYR